MKLAWLTDIHLNFLDVDGRKIYYDEIVAANCDALLISGDIAEAPSLINLLHEMAEQIETPIYFVLGNHDYYKGTIQAVRTAATNLTKTHPQLAWLPAAGIQLLSHETILLGQDGWADGRLGDYANSRVSINDSLMIADLFQKKILGKFQLVEKMQQLADSDALALNNDLMRAIEQQPKKIIVLTHVPPFKEACIHNGQITGDDWLPFFSTKAMGDLIILCARNNPSIDFLVLCGHTHSEAYYQPLTNLTVKTGKAEYYRPTIQEIISI
jgi:predicted phosphohydrolase